MRYVWPLVFVFHDNPVFLHSKEASMSEKYELVKQYLFEHATFPARRFEQVRPERESLCDAVKQGRLPPLYCESEDPNRLVPIVRSPEDFMITVSGDPARDNCFICAQNAYIGYPVSRKIELRAPVHMQSLP